MGQMTSDEVMKELRAGKYRPVYLLMGEETYPTDLISDYIEKNALPADQQGFNQIVVYKRDTTYKQIAMECDQYPTFAERRVVILKEAQATSESRSDTIDDLEGYCNHALATTVLVICYKYKSVDKRKKVVKAIEKCGGAIVESKKLYDNQMGPWITQMVRGYGYSIEDKAVSLLVESIGTDQTNAAKAIGKIRSAVGESLRTITAEMVYEHVGVSREYNAFELCNALFRRDKVKVYEIVKAFGSNEKQYPLPPTLAALHFSFQRLFLFCYVKATTRDIAQAAAAAGERSEYNIKTRLLPAAENYSAVKCMKALELINEYDMRSKGFGGGTQTTNRDMLIELVAKIMQ